jgi:hypothetical protein
MEEIMAKVRCKACQNEEATYCVVKKTSVAINKPRKCEAFILAENKVKAKEPIPTERIGYIKQQELKAKAKAERKALLKMLREGPGNGTAKNLGLDTDESRIIMPGDPRYSVPTSDPKHPLTGDLSKFKTTADVKPENTHASKVKV